MSFKYIRSFVMGGLMGVVAGMLLVPRINEDTKRKLINQGIEIVDDASEKLSGVPRA